MKQLALDIQLDAPPSFDNFVTGANGGLINALHAAVMGERPVYLWGEPASGRTHLLRAAVSNALAAARPATYVNAAEVAAELPDQSGMLLAIDDVEALSDDGQIALFNAFNRARALNLTLLLSGYRPPLGLAVREDLRTRIGQCLIFEVKPLDDPARAAILGALATRRGMRLGEEVVTFILRHGRRDLRSLLKTVEALDEASLQRQRPVTLPLLRELVQQGLTL